MLRTIILTIIFQLAIIRIAFSQMFGLSSEHNHSGIAFLNSPNQNDRWRIELITTNNKRLLFASKRPKFLDEIPDYYFTTIIENDTTIFRRKVQCGITRFHSLYMSKGHFSLNFSDTCDVLSIQDTLDELFISTKYSPIRLLCIKNSIIRYLGIFQSILGSRVKPGNKPILFGKFDSIIIEHARIEGILEIGGNSLPKHIRLMDLEFADNSELALTGFKIIDFKKPCDLFINDELSPNIKFNYEYFKLILNDKLTTSYKDYIFRQLLEMQQRNNFSYGYEKIDKEYRQFKYLNKSYLLGNFQNWLDAVWWDYGYDKFKVVVNSFIIFFLLSFLNFFLYSKLVYAYYPDKFKQIDERLKANNMDDQPSFWIKAKIFFTRNLVILIYTGFIFWGLKLDFKELELRKPLYLLIVIFQYIIGLICLAYIANYVITK
ncbi:MULTISPECIES: hypothetical protein [Niastella]|uniref:Uncharacterized protein n=1 Tax=Niastella soli TaxID=2821487 RepID=A0ABS3YY13_9BACT|nr:hypothetical protein [Niastella soli]MBO9202618.1 hypothetical protein [Niastella soli]